MSRSVLLQLARDSIQEVFEAQRTIDAPALLQAHPLLAQNIPITLNIFFKEELKSSYTIQKDVDSLINNIIIGAKKAAFENGEIFTTSEYLDSEIELILETPDGVISQRDEAIIVPTYPETVS